MRGAVVPGQRAPQQPLGHQTCKIVQIFNNISNKIIQYYIYLLRYLNNSFKVSSDISLPQVIVSKGEGGVHTWSCTPSVLSRIVEL